MTHRQTIDLRDPKPRRTRPASIWSHLPSLGAMNTAEAVAELYEIPVTEEEPCLIP